MLLGALIGYSALPLQPNVAVRIDESRHHPDSGGDSLRVADRLGANHTVDHPEVAIFTFRQHHA